MFPSLLVIVSHFDELRTTFCPGEADAILVIHPDAVLTRSILRQQLKMVTRWDLKIYQPLCGIERIELPR